MERLEPEEHAAQLAEAVCADIALYHPDEAVEALGPFVEEGRALFRERVPEPWHYLFEEASRRLLQARAAQTQRGAPHPGVLVNGVPAPEWDAEMARRRAWPNEHLLDALSRDEGRERQYALEVMGDVVPQSGAIAYRRPWTDRELRRAMDELLKVIVTRAHPASMRALALYSVTRLGLSEPSIMNAVRGGFDDEDAGIRIEAIRSFPADSDLFATYFGDLVVHACTDSSDDVIRTALTRLGDLAVLASSVLDTLIDLLGHSNEQIGISAAYTLHALVVRAGVISKEDVTDLVEARPLRESSAFLLCGLLDSASDAFVQRAGSLGYRSALDKCAAHGPDALGRVLRAFRERDRADFAAFLVRASEEEWNYLALGRGDEGLWGAALRPFADDAEPAERNAIERLLRRWGG